MSRSIATVTAVYSTQCHHEPQYRYRHCCVQCSVPSWAAVSLPSQVCTVLSTTMSHSIATLTAVYCTQCRLEPEYRYLYCCVEYIVPPWAAVSLPSLLCTVLSALMNRSIAIVTGMYSTQCHHEPQDLYRHCCVQYLVSSWAAISLPSLVCTVLSAIMSRGIATVTGVYRTWCHNQPQYRSHHWCLQYSVPSWTAVSLPSLGFTVLSTTMSRSIATVTAVYSTQYHHEPSIATVTAVYSTQCHHEPQYRYRHWCLQYSVPSWAAVSLPSQVCTVLSTTMSRSIATVTARYCTQCHHESQYRYRHWWVQYSVPSWAAVSLLSLMFTVPSAITSRSIASVTGAYNTQCHHEQQSRYRHWCVQYSVPSWAAVSLPSLVCTVLSAIFSRSIATVTSVYSNQCHHEPQYR